MILGLRIPGSGCRRGIVSTASTSVSKTESPGSNPGAPAKVFSWGTVWGEIEETLSESQRLKSV